MLSSITRDHVERKVAKWNVPVFRILTRILLILVIAALSVSAVALWPQNGTLGGVGADADSHGVRDAFVKLRAENKGATSTVKVTEKQINAYLKKYKTSSLNLQSVSVKLGSEALMLRIVVPLLGNGGIESADATTRITASSLSLTIDMDCRVLESSTFRIDKMTVGHLPVPSFLVGPVLATLADRLGDDKEWDLLAAGFQKLVIADESLTATLKK